MKGGVESILGKWESSSQKAAANCLRPQISTCLHSRCNRQLRLKTLNSAVELRTRLAAFSVRYCRSDRASSPIKLNMFSH